MTAGTDNAIIPPVSIPGLACHQYLITASIGAIHPRRHTVINDEVHSWRASPYRPW